MLPSLVWALLVITLPVFGSAEAAPPSGTTNAGGNNAEPRYRACMDQIGSDATRALRKAEAWQKQGGGDAARHCAAAAEMALGRFAQAGETLDALARGGARDTPLLRASLFAQAAHAWLAADMTDRAEVAATHALALAPGDSGVLILRARARAGQRRFGEAVADLDQVVAADPNSADAYVFRASALRQEQALDSATADLEKALALDPRHPEALLERGIVRLLKGDGEGARADWRTLVTADPKTPAAEQARLNLERIDKAE